MQENKPRFGAETEPSREQIQEQAERLWRERSEGRRETKEFLSSQEEQRKEQIKKELEELEISSELKQEIEKVSSKFSGLADEKKISYLVEVAFEKGPCFAFALARKYGDYFLIDLLHDILAKDNLYERLILIHKI